MPTVDYAPHANLEKRVLAYLGSRDYVSYAAPYHDSFPPEITRILQYRFSLTALHLRGRADRIAVHAHKKIEFEWEAKTHESKKYGDLTLEALPLTHHRYKALLGVRCLYVFDVNGREGGFWVHKLPPIRVLMYTDRVEWAPFKTLLIPRMESALSPLQVRDGVRPMGSGDPFVVIDESVISSLPHWSELIDNCE